MNEFWMVWCEEEMPPRVKHSSETMAVLEAERLARKNPGQRFFILHCLEYLEVNVNPVHRVLLDEIPS